jgi:hypothetical protein
MSEAPSPARTTHIRWFAWLSRLSVAGLKSAQHMPAMSRTKCLASPVDGMKQEFPGSWAAVVRQAPQSPPTKRGKWLILRSLARRRLTVKVKSPANKGAGCGKFHPPGTVLKPHVNNFTVFRY